MLIRVVLPAPFSPITAWISPRGDGEIDVIVGDQRAVALDDADRLRVSSAVKRVALYFAVIGSAILTAPLTIWSRSTFTLAIASG